MNPKEWSRDYLTVDLPLPNIFKELTLYLDDLIHAFDKDLGIPNHLFHYTIAGGCLSNLYINQKHGTNHSIKDIDVFIEAPLDAFKDHDRLIFEAIFNTKITRLEEDRSTAYSFVQIPVLYQFEFQGYEIELIFCSDIKRVFDFDLSFRQFYLFDDIVYAHKQALKDVDEKIIRMMSPVSPLSTFSRMKHFEETLGFSIDEKSLHLVKWLISNKHYVPEQLTEYVEARDKLSKNTKKWIKNWVGRHTNSGDPFEQTICDKDATFPYDYSLKSYFLENCSNIFRNVQEHHDFGIWGKRYYQIEQFKHPVPLFQKKFSVDYFDVFSEVGELTTYLKTFIRSKRIESVVGNTQSMYGSVMSLDELDFIYELLQKSNDFDVFELLFNHRMNGEEITFRSLLHRFQNVLLSELSSLDDESRIFSLVAQMNPIYVTNECKNMPHAFLNKNVVTITISHNDLDYSYTCAIKDNHVVFKLPKEIDFVGHFHSDLMVKQMRKLKSWFDTHDIYHLQ